VLKGEVLLGSSAWIRECAFVREWVGVVVVEGRGGCRARARLSYFYALVVNHFGSQSLRNT